MKVKPLQDRILIKRVEEEAKTKAGSSSPTPRKRSAGGPGRRRGPRQGDGHRHRVACEVKAGDRILFGKYSGTDIKVDGVEHLILREDDILAVITK